MANKKDVAKEFDREGKVSLWNQVSAKGTEYFFGVAVIDGVEYNITLFNNASDNERAPALNGNIKLKEDR